MMRHAYRITQESCQRLGGEVTLSYSYGITSLEEAAASARDLLSSRNLWR